MSRFVLRFAWRETRGAWRHFGYFLACVTLGVSALVAVGSFADSLERTVARSAKSLMGGDVEIRSTQPLPLDDPAAPIPPPGSTAVAVTRVRELVAMAQADPSRTQLVELKAVEPGYPFYGALVTDPPRPLEQLIGDGRALVHESLLARLGLRVGDRFRVGEAELTVSGVVLKEPDRAVGVFSLGPRVIIAAADLDRTGLVRPGSRVRYRTLFRLPEGASAEWGRAMPSAFMIAMVARFSLTKALTLTATPMPPTMRATSPVSPRYMVSWSQKRRRPGWACV